MASFNVSILFETPPETDMRLIQRCKFLEDQDEKKAIQHLLKERGYTKAEILKLTIDG